MATKKKKKKVKVKKEEVVKALFFSKQSLTEKSSILRHLHRAFDPSKTTLSTPVKKNKRNSGHASIGDLIINSEELVRIYADIRAEPTALATKCFRICYQQS